MGSLRLSAIGEKSLAWWRGLPLARVVLLLAAAFFIHHGVMWTRTVVRNRTPWVQVLNNYDAEWYSRIATEGYAREQSYAYFPLYPLAVRGLSEAVRLPGYPQVVGALFSTLLFALACLGLARLLAQADPRDLGLLPQTAWGWFFFLYSPASYVFHSHHTESLFLVLSFGAFVLVARGRWLPAAALAGLSALVRSQGVFVAVGVGVGAAMLDGPRHLRLRRFVVAGLVGAALFSLFPLYAYLAHGDPLAFAHVKSYWTHARGFGDAVRALWLGNPWQNTSDVSIAELVFFWALVASLPRVFARSVPFGTCALLSLAVIMVQGELAGALRYGSVLFLCLFAIGDIAARAHPLVRWGGAAALVLVNDTIAWRYLRHYWSY